MYWIIQNALIGLTISFIGSVPLGVQNLTSIKIALERGVRAAVAFALGCASIEFLYSTIAVKLTQFLLKSEMLRFTFQSVSTGLFLVVGILFLTRKSAHQALPLKGNTYYLGVAISLLNVAAIPFWLVYTTFLSGNGWIRLDTDLQLLGFILGIPIGTTLILSTYAALGERLNRRFDLQRFPVNRVIGVVLIGLSVYGAVQMIWF